MMSHAVYRFTTRLAILLSAVVLAAPGTASAQEWAQKLFSEQSHNFGTVATGSDCWHRIKITNNLRDNLQITGVRTSCSCAMVKQPEQTVLKSLESTYVEIGMDTTRFMRDRNSNLIVSLVAGPPEAQQFAEVRIPVQVYIRTDVVLNPGDVNFGAVEKGSAAERKVAIAYEGRANWQIGKVEVKDNPYFTAKVVESFRDNISKVNYDLVVALKSDAPVGAFRQQIALVTDDANAPLVPVLVQGRVEADVIVTPAIQTLGSMAPGDEKTVNFVIRGHKPLQIEKIEVDSSRQNCKMVMPKDSRPVHVLPITITAPKDAGEFSEQFTVTIEGRSEPVTFTARGKCVATSAKVDAKE